MCNNSCRNVFTIAVVILKRTGFCFIFRSAVFAQYDVGMAGESGMVEAIAEATGKEILAHKYLGACSLALYSSHAAVALLLCHLVHLAAKIRINSDIAKEIRGFFIGYRCKGD